MSHWPRNAMSLYVAVAVHVVLFFLIGWLAPSQLPQGDQTGLRLSSAGSTAVEALLDAIPNELLNRQQTVATPAGDAPEAPPNAEGPDIDAVYQLQQEPSPRQEELAPPQPEPETPVTASQDTMPESLIESKSWRGGGGMNTYFARLRQHLADHRMAMPSAWQGAETLIGFELQADGWVSKLRVVESSGIPEMDAAAFALLDRALPLPRPPKSVLGPLLVPISAGRAE